MKEVVDDLEWPGGPVTILMQRGPPPRLVVSAVGTGRMEAELPVGELSGFHCEPAELLHAYKYKSMRAAFCNLPGPKDAGTVRTKVSIDANGLVKVTHLISLAQLSAGGSGAHGSEGGGPAHGSPGGGWGRGGGGGGGSGTQHTSAALDLSRTATVHFFMLPQADLM
eukprot:365408-Chlamydomonas_euryale.AAC.8